jgi:hypothetical protein
VSHFIVRVHPPVLLALIPNSGAIGDSIVITGRNFGPQQENSRVTFNGVLAAVTTWSNTAITVTVPPSATTGLVRITVGVQTSNGAIFTVTASGSIITVGPVGRNFTTVQAAVNAAVAGDTIQCDAGHVFTEVVTFPNKGVLATPITLTTNAAPASLPPAGTRTSPAYAAFMPTIVSPGSGQSGMVFAASSNNYILRHLNLPGVPFGFNSIVTIGAGGTTQQFYAQEPYNITIDQCYIHGGAVCGQKRGIETHGRYITITNNYIDQIKSVGQDSQSISGYNGHGPVTITNNLLRGGTEPIIFGGADPNVRTFMTCTGIVSSTAVNVTCSEAGHTLSELNIGQGLSILAGGVWTFTTITGVTGGGVSGLVAYAPIVGTPDIPGGLRAGVVLGMEGVMSTISGNLCGNDPAWINGNLPQPTGVVAIGAVGGGTRAAGTHYYTVQAFNPNGYQANPVFYVNSAESAEVNATLAAPGHITISWAFDPNATVYRVWHGVTTGVRTEYHDATVSPYVDDGTAMIAATPFGATAHEIKNVFELKAIQNVVVSGNIFQYHWKGASNGWATWLKTVNQDGTGSYLQTKNVTVEKNIYRHCDGWMEVHGSEIPSGSGFPLPGPLTNMTVRNNLVYDSGPQWGQGFEIFATNISNGIVNLTIDHNTVIHTTNLTGGGLMTMDPAQLLPITGYAITNNMLRKETNGIKAPGFAAGTASLAACTTGGYVYSTNAVAGATAASDGAANFYETAALWQGEFVNYVASGVNADFHIKSTSAYHNAASDGTDLGADIDAVLNATAHCDYGDPHLGDLTFTPDLRAGVTNYTANVYTLNTNTPVIAFLSLGVPTPEPITGLIRVNLAAFLNTLPAGNYDVKVASTAPVGGTIESAASTGFTIPLVP